MRISGVRRTQSYYPSITDVIAMDPPTTASKNRKNRDRGSLDRIPHA